MNVAVRASSTNDMTKAGSGVADYLNSQVVTNRQLTYQAQDLLKQASELQSLSETTNRQLIWIAAISGGGRHRRHEHHAGFRHRAHP